MPIFKVGASENVYYDIVYIEAENAVIAQEIYAALEEQASLSINDTDGLVFDTIEEIDQLPPYTILLNDSHIIKED